jgi:hypothetical protein
VRGAPLSSAPAREAEPVQATAGRRRGLWLKRSGPFHRHILAIWRLRLEPDVRRKVGDAAGAWRCGLTYRPRRPSPSRTARASGYVIRTSRTSKRARLRSAEFEATLRREANDTTGQFRIHALQKCLQTLRPNAAK